MANNIEIKNIKPIINNDLFKLIKQEISNILNNINTKYNIQDDLNELYSENISKIGVKFGIKKRNRRTLPNELQCMGRKLDGLQCTRSKRPGNDYCLSHIKNLPHGRIDDETFDLNNKSSKNKKKNLFNQENTDFIATHIEIINNEKVLIDSNNNMYSFNIDAPVFLGKKMNV
jgi:hypothetical protein